MTSRCSKENKNNANVCIFKRKNYTFAKYTKLTNLYSNHIIY